MSYTHTNTPGHTWQVSTLNKREECQGPGVKVTDCNKAALLDNDLDKPQFLPAGEMENEMWLGRKMLPEICRVTPTHVSAFI